jgi:hypothetical protein
MASCRTSIPRWFQSRGTILGAVGRMPLRARLGYPTSGSSRRRMGPPVEWFRLNGTISIRASWRRRRDSARSTGRLPRGVGDEPAVPPRRCHREEKRAADGPDREDPPPGRTPLPETRVARPDPRAPLATALRGVRRIVVDGEMSPTLRSRRNALQAHYRLVAASGVSTQPRLRSTPRCHRAMPATRLASSIDGSQRRSARSIARSSSRPFQNPTASPAA